MKASSNEDGLTLKGTVIEKDFGAGSKSEHTAVYLQTDDGDYLLRKLGGNPFSDDSLKAFVGQKVVATGKGTQALFVASNIEACED